LEVDVLRVIWVDLVRKRERERERERKEVRIADLHEESR